MADSRTPYVLSGVVNDVDGSTALAGATVVVIDTNLDENIQTTTSSDGSWSLDLADLSSEYTDEDSLQVCFYKDNKSCWRRHTVDTDVGVHDFGTVSLLPFKIFHPTQGKYRMISYNISNSHSSALYVDFYDAKNDEKLLRVEVPANDTKSHYFGVALKFDYGICVIREDNTANRLNVTITGG